MNIVVLVLVTVCLLGCVTPISPISPTDPDLVRWRKFAETRGLKWEITVGATEMHYCLGAYKPPDMNTDPHSYHINCDWPLSLVINETIHDYVSDKPGYDERWQSKPLASGGPKQ
jgi:hypothetical protein